jgi:hypothetical protein
MVVLGAYAGLRVHEIAKVHVDDVDLAEGTVRVVGKGESETTNHPFDLANKQFAAFNGVSSDAVVLRPKETGATVSPYIWMSTGANAQARPVRSYESSAAGVNPDYARTMTRPASADKWGYEYEAVNKLHIVSKTFYCRYYAPVEGGPTYQICGMWIYFNVDEECGEAQLASNPGDSGAPTYTLMSGGGADALGYHIGQAGMQIADGLLCHDGLLMMPLFSVPQAAKFSIVLAN